MTRVFVFTNHKGGVGKSTSATNTALGITGMLRRAGAPNARVLLIDTDSQAHATLVTTGTKDYGTDDSLYTVLMADRQNAAQTLLNCIVQSTWDADLHVLPASPMLEGAERELMGIVDVSQGVTQQFRIETGERRYWATWLLRNFVPGSNSDGMIPCIIIPAERSSVFRQAKENTARSGLSAIAMARQAALLLLTIHGYSIPDAAVPNDFYRQALELDLRGKREYTEAVLSAMGGIKKGHFSEIKALLKLSDEALEMADRHNIEEGKLRHVVAVPVEYHAELVRQIVDFNLTSKQVKDLCQGEGLDDGDNELLEKLPPAAVKMAKVTHSVTTTSPQDFVLALIRQEGDPAVALVRLQAMRKLILDAERLLSGE